MRLIHLANWRDAALETGTYRIAARNVEAAIARFKERFPGIEPGVCFWYEEGENIKVYCFCWNLEY